MSDESFHYALRPNQSNPGTWSARVVLQEDYLQSQLIADVMADLALAGITLTASQVQACGTAILTRILRAAKASRKTRGLFGLMDFTPTAGGVIPHPDTPPSPELLNVDVRVQLTDEGFTLYVSGMTFGRDAVEGIRAPGITTVLRFDDNLPYRYTAATGFRIIGTGFGQKPNLATGSPNGVYAIPVGGGAAVRVSAYSRWTDTEIGGTWPAGLSGDHYVRVVTSYVGTTDPRSDETTLAMTP